MKFPKVSTQSVVAVILVVGCLALAWKDNGFRLSYFDLAKVGLGGYLGQSIPQVMNNLEEKT